MVIALTLVLGGFIFFTLQQRLALRLSFERDSDVALIAPTEEAYRAQAKAALAPVLASDEKNRAAAADLALTTLLSLRVPATDTAAHLAFARALNRLRDGLKGDKTRLKDGQAQLDAAVQAYPWIHL